MMSSSAKDGAVGAGRQKAAAPQSKARPRDQMRAGEHGRRSGGQRNGQGCEGVDGRQVTSEVVQQHGGGQTGRGSGQYQDALHSGCAERQCHEGLA
jgi:hypothetical protein